MNSNSQAGIYKEWPGHPDTSQLTNFYTQAEEKIMNTVTILSCSVWFTTTLAVPWARIEDIDSLEFPQMEERTFFDDSNVAEDVMELNKSKSKVMLSKLEISLVRCCSSVLDTFQEVARCFEVNGFGGINFSRKLCTHVNDVSGSHK